jgi:hypothetical protein
VSRIFDALKRAEKERLSGGTDPAAMPQIERRRSARWNARLIVFVYGHAPDWIPFHEKASSLNVSAVGARLSMITTVRPGQSLLLTNNVTQAEQECRVAYVARGELQSIEVAVEFLGPRPDFWHIIAAPPPTQPGKRTLG